MLTVDAITHIMIGVLMVILLIVALRQLRRKFNSYGLIIIAITAGLVWDNFILGFGGMIGYGETLKTLNAPRFITHALLTPMLIIYAFGMARMIGLKWAQSRAWHIAFCVLATALIALGSVQDIFNLKLVPYEADAQVLGYRNDFVLFRGPPIPAVVAIIVVIVVGALMLWRARWGWLIAGGALMFVGAMAMLRFPVVGNIGELALGLTTITTYLAAEQGVIRLKEKAGPPAARAPKPAAAAAPERAITPQRQIEIKRKERMRVANLVLGWLTLIGVIMATFEGNQASPAWVGVLGKSIYFIGIFLHAFAGLYLYGVPILKPNLRVIDMYVGFAVFAVILINRTVVNNAALASASWLLMWAPIGVHIALGAWFAQQRISRRVINPRLKFYLGGSVIRDATQ